MIDNNKNLQEEVSLVPLNNEVYDNYYDNIEKIIEKAKVELNIEFKDIAK